MNPADVLEFWFGAPGSAEHGSLRKCWFEKDPAFDAEIRRRFLALVDEAAAGRLDDWADRPEGLLALIVLLDQFPRNLFRDAPRAFATDAQALALAQQALAQGVDALLMPVARAFIYLPFEHSEDLAMQDRAVALFSALAQHGEAFASYLDYAERHRDVIRRFGRFPHRNAILGRASTPEEIAFLARPGAGF
ncbi:MAG: DUF924 domain-containing protein [Rhodocyclaceae bacterium]|nr:DUF924 domain-containing protein [Rhodocyclaceae bacterium]